MKSRGRGAARKPCQAVARPPESTRAWGGRGPPLTPSPVPNFSFPPPVARASFCFPPPCTGAASGRRSWWRLLANSPKSQPAFAPFWQHGPCLSPAPPQKPTEGNGEGAAGYPGEHRASPHRPNGAGCGRWGGSGGAWRGLSAPKPPPSAPSRCTRAGSGCWKAPRRREHHVGGEGPAWRGGSGGRAGRSRKEAGKGGRWGGRAGTPPRNHGVPGEVATIPSPKPQPGIDEAPTASRAHGTAPDGAPPCCAPQKSPCPPTITVPPKPSPCPQTITMPPKTITIRPKTTTTSRIVPHGIEGFPSGVPAASPGPPPGRAPPCRASPSRRDGRTWLQLRGKRQSQARGQRRARPRRLIIFPS